MVGIRPSSRQGGWGVDGDGEHPPEAMGGPAPAPLSLDPGGCLDPLTFPGQLPVHLKQGPLPRPQAARPPARKEAAHRTLHHQHLQGEGVVPGMVGLVPSMVGVVPSMVGVVPSMVTKLLQLT